MARASISERRAHLGTAAVYSLQEAAELLPGETKNARKWLVEQGLVMEGPEGCQWVIWDDVLTALRASNGRLATERRTGGVAVTMSSRRR